MFVNDAMYHHVLCVHFPTWDRHTHSRVHLAGRDQSSCPTSAMPASS